MHCATGSNSATAKQHSLHAVALTMAIVDSTVAPVRLGVVTLPCLPPASRSLVELMTSAQSTRFLAGCRETSGFAVLNSKLGRIKKIERRQLLPCARA